MECHLSNRQPGQLSNKSADWAWVAETKIKAEIRTTHYVLRSRRWPFTYFPAGCRLAQKSTPSAAAHSTRSATSLKMRVPNPNASTPNAAQKR